MLPDALIHGQALLTVVITHILTGDALNGTLVFSYTGALVFDANFLVESCQIVAFATHTLEVNHTCFIDKQTVGNRGYIVAGLHILVGIGDNPFAALLEIFQSIANLLGSSGRVENGGAALDINTLDVFVVLSLLDSSEDIIQPHVRHVGSTKQCIKGRAFFRTLVDRSVQFQYQYGVFFNLCGGVSACHDASK